MTIYTNDDAVIRIAKAAFPDYKGRQFKLEVQDSPLNCKSYWDGGTRAYFRFIHLDTLEATAEMPAQSMYDIPITGLDAVVLPDNIACVKHQIFCGKDLGLTIIVRPENAATLLPPPSVLTRDQEIVLAATRSFKSSYGGKSGIRFHEANLETGINQSEWDQAYAELIAKGLLTPRGAITNDGRNAIGQTGLNTLRKEQQK